MQIGELSGEFGDDNDNQSNDERRPQVNHILRLQDKGIFLETRPRLINICGNIVMTRTETPTIENAGYIISDKGGVF